MIVPLDVLDKAQRVGWAQFIATGHIDDAIAAAIDSLPEPESADVELAAPTAVYKERGKEAR